ncbi:MAG: dihydrofolate reductase family protein [Pyrinomonadaceae bacterium]
MRKVIFGGANSLDNFFARTDNSVDWLLWSDDVTEIMKDLWPRFDCMVMGRKTYEVSIAMGAPSHAGIDTYVFSRTMTPGRTDNGYEVVADDPGDFVRRLKQQEGKDIMVMGGGDLARTLFEADVIDEIGLNIQPVLLGSGIPLFYEMSRQIDLELIDCRRLKKGCVYVTYSVKHQQGQ